MTYDVIIIHWAYVFNMNIALIMYTCLHRIDIDSQCELISWINCRSFAAAAAAAVAAATATDGDCNSICAAGMQS